MRKFFTLSFDDGVEQDKTIIRLLKKYSVPATFNLNSGLFSDVRYLKYSGVSSICTVSEQEAKSRSDSEILTLSRIPEDEISQVYEGFEIATHTPHHERLTEYSDSQVASLLSEDRETLQKYSSFPVVGHAFPFGASNNRICSTLESLDFLYARGVVSCSDTGNDRFSLPDCRYNFNPTCRITDDDIETLLNEFISADGSNQDMMFYMWGHSYEIDFQSMKDRKFLYAFERMLDTVACNDAIVKCTNAQLFTFS